MTAPRLVRVSARGRWHVVQRVIRRTRATQTECGRILAPTAIGERARADEMPRMCAMCSEVFTQRAERRRVRAAALTPDPG